MGPNPTLKTLKHLLGILSTFFKGGDAKQTQARLGLLCGHLRRGMFAMAKSKAVAGRMLVCSDCVPLDYMTLKGAPPLSCLGQGQS